LSWRCGITPGAAREKVRVARALAVLPITRAAFERGELSYSKVRALTRAATPANEDYLVTVSKDGTAQPLENPVRKYRSYRTWITGPEESAFERRLGDGINA
jgi:hypothetical protein